MRKDLLTNALDKEANAKLMITELVEDDATFVKRAISNLEGEKEDAEKALKRRLKEPTAIDNAVIENLYGTIKQLDEKLNLYKSFQKEYIKDKE